MTHCSGDYSCCNSSSQAGSCCDGSSETLIWNNATLLPRADLAGSLATITATVTKTLTQADTTASTQSPSTTVLSTSCSNHDVALGAGLGVPLAPAIVTIPVMGWILARRPKIGNQEVVKTMGHTPEPSGTRVTGSVASELPSSTRLSRFRDASELANSQR